ncbi:9711_t:CDS:2, partial [Cetraspora pellucida]
LEYIDTDLELAEGNASLEIKHIEVESNSYLARTDSSNLNGTTSNLWRHLKSKHHISRAMVERTLVEIFSKAAKYSFNYPKQKKLNSNLATFIVEELQSFSILRSQTLIKIIKDLDFQASTSDNDDPYIGFTFHWVNRDFQVREIVGEISYLPYSHTAK